MVARPYRKQAVARHHDRLALAHYNERLERARFLDWLDEDGREPEPDATPELREALHALNLHWLREYPGYRAAVVEKVQAELRARARREAQITLPSLGLDPDVDLLGREIEGCG